MENVRTNILDIANSNEKRNNDTYNIITKLFSKHYDEFTGSFVITFQDTNDTVLT